MTEQENKARFKQAIDRTLSGIEGDPFLAQRVIANAEKGEKTMKHAFPKGLVIALILILSMSAVAVAAGVFGGTVNWLGEVVEDEQVGEVLPTVAPFVPQEIDDVGAIIDAAAEAYERDGELLVITRTEEDGSIVPVMSRRVVCALDSEAELRALLGEAALLPLPAFIPEGYEFVRAEVIYACRAGGAHELIARHDMAAGVTVNRYRIRSGDEFPQGYYLFYRDSQEDYHYLSITVQLRGMRDVTEQSFGFLAGQTAQRVEVAGMDNALAITGDKTCHLNMRRVLAEPLGYTEIFDLVPMDGAYAEVDVIVSAPLLDVDTLVSMFATE